MPTEIRDRFNAKNPQPEEPIPPGHVRILISLNGTSTNPWHKMGLTQNPFPCFARTEFMDGARRLDSLGGAPIPHATATEHIRERLEGFDAGFIEMVVAQFKPGEIVKFSVTFPE